MNTPQPGTTRIIGKGRATAAGPGPDVMAAGTLDGDKVYTTDGDDVGKIKEIMLDVRTGRVAYAVLSSGGLLGIGDKLLAIPWSALTLDTDRKCFLVSVSSERIKNAPGFDKSHWPTMADPNWAASLHQYYGSTPYWSDADEELGIDAPPHEASPDQPERGEGRH
ncbi:PRC-barrel domain-containing protein [Burkholderia mayonis]|uniref:Photosystem reaction center subunit H n=1 Tax=Burkholderia mayonis TaxID=1385591 RepID=A0A1B4FW54_9BURK|nr:PRC-barrel domain-containing protein [Burkholderia mayonis]AOJ07892.1 photosystem reaction center subunit H [Burkholderia mayonis]KVE55396.1 photosystem reaction center subunit H [Burkholderia mayonis]